MPSGATRPLASQLLAVNPSHAPNLQGRLPPKVSERQVPYYLFDVFLSCISQARRTFPLAQSQPSPYGNRSRPTAGWGVSFFKFGRCFPLSEKRYKMVVRFSGWMTNTCILKGSTCTTEITEKNTLELFIAN